MLVITRKPEESIVIGDNIEITIFEIGKDKVRIGIEAPKNVKISRKEILVTENENIQASAEVSIDIVKQLFNINKEEK